LFAAFVFTGFNIFSSCKENTVSTKSSSSIVLAEPSASPFGSASPTPTPSPTASPGGSGNPRHAVSPDDLALPNYLSKSSWTNLWAFYHSAAVPVFPLYDSSTKVTSAVYLTDQTSATPRPLQTTLNADINARVGWAYATDCSSILVAVVDSGIDRNHPDLTGSIHINSPAPAADPYRNQNDTYGWNFVGSKASAPAGYTNTNNNNTLDDLFHGTFVAGIIGATGNNGSGLPGVCWKANLLPIKTFDNEGSGATSDIIEGLKYAQALGAKIINNSYGLYLDPNDTNDASALSLFQTTVSSLNSSGILFIAAAGNGVAGSSGVYNGVNIDTYAEKAIPAGLNLSNVIAVANTNALDRLDSTSNWGPNGVQLAAPGTYVTSTMIHTQSLYDSSVGTSFSAPYVTGAAALYWSAHPSATAAQVKSQILTFTEPVSSLSGKVLTGGRLNLGDLMSGIHQSRPQ
jgi:subtilisin family serine protease